MLRLARKATVFLRYLEQRSLRHCSSWKGVTDENCSHSLKQHKSISTVKDRMLSSKLQNVLPITDKEFAPFIRRCEINEEDTILQVEWSNQESSKYPLMFLRDNCLCSKCRDSTMKERVINYWCVGDVGVKCIENHIVDGGIILKWNDGHQSYFTQEFLEEFKFPETETDIKSYGAIYAREFWHAENTTIQRFNYEDVMNDSKILLNYIKTSLKFGVSLIYGMPRNPNEIFKFGERICYLKVTLYGPTFHIKTTDDPINVGYSPIPLYLHSDQPNCSYQPEVMLLNCIEQSKTGGENEIADAMKAAYMLKETDRKAYDILKQVNCRFDDIGKDKRGPFHVACEKPIIQEDNYGEIDVVRVNDYRRGILVNSTAEKAHEWYKAYDKFKALIIQPENVLKYKLGGGEMLTIDNRRVLHGRQGHENDPSGRWMVGAYIGMDEYLSKLRTLEVGDSESN